MFNKTTFYFIKPSLGRVVMGGRLPSFRAPIEYVSSVSQLCIGLCLCIGWTVGYWVVVCMSIFGTLHPSLILKFPVALSSSFPSFVSTASRLLFAFPSFIPHNEKFRNLT